MIVSKNINLNPKKNKKIYPKNFISIQESKKFIEDTLEDSENKDEILNIINREISKLNDPNDHVLILTIKKDKWSKVNNCIKKLDRGK